MVVGIFFSLQPDSPKQPRTSFPFYKFFYPTISGRITGSKSFEATGQYNSTKLLILLPLGLRPKDYGRMMTRSKILNSQYPYPNPKQIHIHLFKMYEKLKVAFCRENVGIMKIHGLRMNSDKICEDNSTRNTPNLNTSQLFRPICPN